MFFFSSLPLQAVDMGEWFDSFSDLKSAGGDPMPLAPADTNSSGGYTNADGRPANVYTGVTDQLLVRGQSRVQGAGAGAWMDGASLCAAMLTHWDAVPSSLLCRLLTQPACSCAGGADRGGALLAPRPHQLRAARRPRLLPRRLCLLHRWVLLLFV